MITEYKYTGEHFTTQAAGEPKTENEIILEILNSLQRRIGELEIKLEIVEQKIKSSVHI